MVLRRRLSQDELYELVATGDTPTRVLAALMLGLRAAGLGMLIGLGICWVVIAVVVISNVL